MSDALSDRLRDYFTRAAIPGVVGVYLFGSRATGRVHRDSDVDVGVLLDRAVVPERRDRFALRVRLAADLPAIVGGTPADVVVLNDAPPELARHVAVQGRLLFDSDRSLNHAFVRDAQLRAADIAPFLRRARRVKLEALRS